MTVGSMKENLLPGLIVGLALYAMAELIDVKEAQAVTNEKVDQTIIRIDHRLERIETFIDGGGNEQS